MSLARLTSLSTQTLTLLLERNRLLSLSPGTAPPQSTTASITRNLAALRTGILELDDAPPDAVRVLREQYERMRLMLGADGAALETLSVVPPPQPPPQRKATPEPSYVPYTDDDPAEVPETEVLATQRQLMEELDTQLDTLSHSIRRHHDLGLQIGDELDVHTGLLTDLEADIDHTTSRLSGAQTRLNRVAEGARKHWSTLTIGGLIFVLLLLIVGFKTTPK